MHRRSSSAARSASEEPVSSPGAFPLHQDSMPWSAAEHMRQALLQTPSSSSCMPHAGPSEAPSWGEASSDAELAERHAAALLAQAASGSQQQSRTLGLVERQDSANYQPRPPAMTERQDSARNLQASSLWEPQKGSLDQISVLFSLACSPALDLAAAVCLWMHAVSLSHEQKQHVSLTVWFPFGCQLQWCQLQCWLESNVISPMADVGGIESAQKSNSTALTLAALGASLRPWRRSRLSWPAQLPSPWKLLHRTLRAATLPLTWRGGAPRAALRHRRACLLCA